MAINRYFRNISSLTKRGAMAALIGSMTALLVSCGGGGTQGGAPTASGSLSILPDTGSLYANVPYTFTVAGGRAPYDIVSNEPTLIIPNRISISGNTFTAVPNQPGVVDIGQDPNQVPSRKVTLTVRDSTGTQVNGTYDVLQNFLTGYGLSITTLANCSTAAAGATSSTQACAGADSLVSLVPVSNGVRYANKQMRFTSLLGPFSFILDSTGITGGTVTATADTAGGVTARIRVQNNAATQYAQFRLTDVATGAYRDITFEITNANGAQVALSTIPSTLALTGATTAQCGTGIVNLFVYGGKPPYTGTTTFPGSISITPPVLQNNGDAFSIAIFNPNICLGPGTVIVTDSLGAFVTVSVTTTPGSTAPVLPLTAAPNSICIPDSGTGVISISGGNSNKVINSSNPSLATAIPTTGTGNFTTTINALGAGGGVGQAVTLTVSDGGATATINVTRKTTCP